MCNLFERFKILKFVKYAPILKKSLLKIKLEISFLN